MMFARSVLVTGSNRGIGLGLVKHLVGKTQHLFAGCRLPKDADELQKVAKQNKHLVILKLDVTNEYHVENAVEAISAIVGKDGLNCLINNAGVRDEFKTLSSVSSESLMDIFRTNAIGPAILTQTCLPLIRQAASLVPHDRMSVSRAAIINMGTLVSSFELNHTGKLYGYRMSKVALNMLARNLSIDLKDDNILVANIHPGWVKTDLGGRNAPLSVDESVAGIVNVASSLTNEDTGLFYSWDESRIPW